MLRPIAVFVIVVGFISCRCPAWNSTGHEIVAQIALDQLSPDAKAKIFAVLKQHARVHEDLLHDVTPGEDPDLAMFLRAATWPDMIRSPLDPMSRTEGHGNWHYVDYPYELDGIKGPPVEEQWDGHTLPANLIQAMAKATTELKNPQTPADRKAIDLCWVEHLVGDIHQPLHAVSLYSKEFPNGDQGGNQLRIRTSDNGVMNLHAYWDDVEGMSMNPDVIRKTADRIEKDHPVLDLKDQVADLNVVDWAKESLAQARERVYLNGTLPHTTIQEAQNDPDSVPALPAGYEKNALATADVRVALAGYRLGALLEELAKSL
jgi:hypothetical protein